MYILLARVTSLPLHGMIEPLRMKYLCEGKVGCHMFAALECTSEVGAVPRAFGQPYFLACDFAVTGACYRCYDDIVAKEVLTRIVVCFFEFGIDVIHRAAHTYAGIYLLLDLAVTLAGRALLIINNQNV